MNKSNIMKYIAAPLIIFALGVGVGKYITPSGSKETSKETDKNHETIDRDVTAPDGTKIHEHIVKDETKKKESSTTIVENKPNWRVAALGGYSFKSNTMVYGASVEKRVLANIHVGVWGTTERELGLSVGYEF